jgi:hypothetical protein
MSNDKGITKHESTKRLAVAVSAAFFLDFVIRIHSVIRHSDFVIPVASEPTASITDHEHEQEQEEMITLSV